jgi:hypothetical protein
MAVRTPSASSKARAASSGSQQLVSHVDGAIYVCMSTKEGPTVSRVLEEAGAHWSDTIVWAKDRFTLGRADYQRQYEPIWYGWREDAKHNWCGDRDQGDIWQIPRPSTSELHPTMKPLALVERALTNSSREGDRVLDTQRVPATVWPQRALLRRCAHRRWWSLAYATVRSRLRQF